MEKSNKHFLSKIDIASFKNLRNIELEDFGHINLILGDNNVGKTSVLEVLLFDENPNNFLSNLRGTYLHKLNVSHIKGNIDFVTPFLDSKRNGAAIEFNTFLKGAKVGTKYSITSKELGSLTKAQYEKLELYFSNSSPNLHTAIVKRGSREYVIPQNSPSLDNESTIYMPFISPKIIYADDLLNFYSKAIIPSKSKKQQLIQDMNQFIPGLEDIEIATQSTSGIPILITRIDGNDTALPLNMYGDGSIKFFRILVEIATSANARLMIDEIDSGIHFSRLKSLWRTTLNSAIQNNTQLFITTHNDECLAYLKEVLEEEEFKHMQSECRCYTMRQLPDGSTKAFKYEFPNFAFAVNQEIELRGGVL
jgi:AAA15 family ATPase/GTPase